MYHTLHPVYNPITKLMLRIFFLQGINRFGLETRTKGNPVWSVKKNGEALELTAISDMVLHGEK